MLSRRKGLALTLLGLAAFVAGITVMVLSSHFFMADRTALHCGFAVAVFAMIGAGGACSVTDWSGDFHPPFY